MQEYLFFEMLTVLFMKHSQPVHSKNHLNLLGAMHPVLLFQELMTTYKHVYYSIKQLQAICDLNKNR